MPYQTSEVRWGEPIIEASTQFTLHSDDDEMSKAVAIEKKKLETKYRIKRYNVLKAILYPNNEAHNTKKNRLNLHTAGVQYKLKLKIKKQS